MIYGRSVCSDWTCALSGPRRCPELAPRICFAIFVRGFAVLARSLESLGAGRAAIVERLFPGFVVRLRQLIGYLICSLSWCRLWSLLVQPRSGRPIFPGMSEPSFPAC